MHHSWMELGMEGMGASQLDRAGMEGVGAGPFVMLGGVICVKHDGTVETNIIFINLYSEGKAFIKKGEDAEFQQTLEMG